MRFVELRTIPMDKIQTNINQSREIFDKEIIEGIAKSIKKIGLTNPITVREQKDTLDSKMLSYQIIAGELRFRAVKILNWKDIQAKVVDANDSESEIIGLTENYHRKDLTTEEKEKSIYNSWKRGISEDVYRTIADMHEATGIPESTLTRFISSGKEKEDKDNKMVIEIQEASSRELEVTRTLRKIAPETRIELLRQSAIDKRINNQDLEHIVKSVKSASNMKDEVLKEIPKFVADRKLKSSDTEEFIKAIEEVPEKMQKEIVKVVAKEKVIEPDNVKIFVNVLKESPPDIQEKLLKREIDVEEARVINVFPTAGQREVVLKERKIISEEKEKEKKRHTDVRYQQSADLHQGKKPKDITRFDLEDLKNYQSSNPDQQDKRIIDDYQNTKMKLIFKAEDIKNMHTDDAKRLALGIVWQVYEQLYKILVELGEIKVISDAIPSKELVPLGENKW